MIQLARGQPKEPEEKPLTVTELIRLLQSCSKDKVISMQGCDCYGEAGRVEEDDEEVTIMRPRGG